jgi:hypothetical protein
MKKELETTFDSASVREPDRSKWPEPPPGFGKGIYDGKHFIKTAYYTSGYATSDKDLAKKIINNHYLSALTMKQLTKVKDKIINKIKTIKLRRK